MVSRSCLYLMLLIDISECLEGLTFNSETSLIRRELLFRLKDMSRINNVEKLEHNSKERTLYM